jgi:hypothetical protein
MKVLSHDTVNYVKAVFAESKQLVLTMFDIIGIIIFFLAPTIYSKFFVNENCVKSIGAGIFLLSFIIANFRLFQKHEKRLKQFEPDLTKIIISEYNPGLLSPKNQVGIDIRNQTPEDFDGVIELIKLTITKFDDYYNEYKAPISLEENNCHFREIKVLGNDHQVIDLAELTDHFIVFLTEKTTRIDFNLFFHIPSPPGIQQPDFTKSKSINLLKFDLMFELRGKFKKEFFKNIYVSQIKLISDEFGISGQDTTIEINDIKHLPPSCTELG